jgi:hypothetical protein
MAGLKWRKTVMVNPYVKLEKTVLGRLSGQQG